MVYWSWYFFFSFFFSFFLKQNKKVHRIGRTARAGKDGLSISMITQYDVDLITAIESHMKVKMKAIEYVKEDDVVSILNRVRFQSGEVFCELFGVHFDVFERFSTIIWGLGVRLRVDKKTRH